MQLGNTDSSQISSRISAMQPSLIRAVFEKRRASSINLGLGQPSESPPLEILEEGWRQFLASDMGYTSNAGLPQLRKLIAAHHKHAYAFSADNVVVTCGSQEALVAVMAACLNTDDHVLIPDPGFPGYKMTAELLGAVAVPVPRHHRNCFRLCADDLEKAITPKTKLVVINSPANPTGAVDCQDELIRLSNLAEKYNFWILSDEIYSEIYFSDERMPSIADFSNRAIVVSGLSKSAALTGFRLGYAVAPLQISQAIMRAHATTTTCAPTLSQHVAEVIFSNTSNLKMHFELYKTRRIQALECLKKYLPDIEVINPDGAFYIMLKISKFRIDSLEFCLKLVEEEDVIATPGAAFGNVTKEWIRLSFAGNPELFEKGVKKLANFLTNI